MLARTERPAGSISRRSKAALLQRIRFGEFCMDRGTQRLLRDEEPVDLDPRAWDVLCHLVRRAGALVSREEMLAAAWPGVVVSDAALSQAVQRLRRALGDDARQPRYVETVHRRGFRFVAAVHSGASDDAGEDARAAAPAERAVFVGREAERQKLARLLASARAGERQIALLEGAHGIGKTALLNAFLAEYPEGEARVAGAQCVQQEGVVEAYLPVLEALDHFARADAGTIEVLRQCAPTWLAQIPWLLSPDEARGLEESIGDATRARMLREMARALEVVAAEQPLLVVIEDLHWADAATIDLLGSIAQRTEPARLMVLCTYQPARAIACGHPVVDLARRLSARGACTRISLELFGPAEVRAFLARRFPGLRLPDALVRLLHARSEGNPLFLTTIVDHLVERGFAVRKDGSWQLSRSIGSDELRDIPENLREMIELYLDSVDAPALEILEAASAAALEFRTASVVAALGLKEPEAMEAVERGCEQLLTRWRLLREAGGETWPDGTRISRYAFRHELYRQVLYERLPGNRRRRFHQNIGERLEEAYASRPARIAVELAAHFEQSGDDARAVTYFLLAARQARRRFAEREAAAHFASALSHIEKLGPDEDRDRGLQELQARLGLVRARVMTELQRPEDEERNLARIESLAEWTASGAELFRVQLTLAQIHMLRSHPDRAARHTERLVELSAAGDVGQQVEAHLARGGTAMMLADFAAAARDCTRALALCGEGGPRSAPSLGANGRKWREIGSRTHGQLGVLSFLFGAADRARGHLQQSIELCEGRIHPNYAGGRLLTAAGIFCQLGDLEQAQAVSDRGFALAEENQFTSMMAAVSAQRLWLAIERGDREDALARIRAARSDYVSVRESSSAPVGPLFLLDACRIVGLADEGLAIAEEVWMHTRPSGLRWYDAELERLRGELIRMQRKGRSRPKAEACFHRALEVARRQGAAVYELRAAASLFELCRGCAGEAQARARLEQLYGQFREGFDSRDLRAAALLLGRSREQAKRSHHRGSEARRR